MSSKSRHQHTPRKPSQSVDHVDGGQADLPSIEDFEEIVHVPEGRSRFQYIALIGLMIFLLIVFIVPSAFQDALTGGDQRGELPAVTWETPSGVFSMTSTDFLLEKRKEDSFRRTVNPYARTTPSSAEVAATLLLDQLSLDAGVYVSDDAVIESLRGFVQQLGGVEQYKQYMQSSYSGQTVAFETALRRAMRTSRYLETLGRLGAKPSADEIETTWVEQHKEYAFDYIEALASDFKEDALAETPDDATLEAWLGEQPEWKRNTMMTEKAWRLGSAFVNIGEEPSVALLERYPLPEGFDAAAEGEHFYTSYSYLAFKLDEPRIGEDGEELRYIPKEELADQLAASARALTALTAWQEDLKLRLEAGATADIAAEATELGVGWIESSEARDRAALLEDKQYGGGLLTGPLASAVEGDMIEGIIVTNQVIEVVEVLEVVEPKLPPFLALREQVVSDWAGEHSASLAAAYLEDKLTEAGSPETLDAEAFAALANDDDRLTLGLRDWMDQSNSNGSTSFEPASLFIRIQAQALGLYDLSEGGLAAPTVSNGKDRAFLVRSLGSRDRPFSDATPADIEAVQTSLKQSAMVSFRGAFSSDTDELPAYLVQTYKLALPEEAAYKKKQAEERAEREAKAKGGQGSEESQDS